MNQLIRNIWCAVLNYRDTAQEVNAKVPHEPIIFLKAGSTILDKQQPIILPAYSHEVLYEIEIALQFNQNLVVDRIGLALDLTAWDLLQQLEMHAYPWTLAKSFKNACPIGSFISIQDLDSLGDLEFSLEVNGQLQQKGNTRDMVFSLKQLTTYLLTHYPVCPYDLILTGTPPGVDQIRKGDRLIGKISDYYTACWLVAD